MKKTILVVMILAMAFGTFAFADTAYAAQDAPVNPGPGRGEGMGGNGRRGANSDGTGTPNPQNINLEGKLDDPMHDSLADALGITPEDLQSRRDAGESLVEIGLSLGFDQDAVFEMMADVRVAALTQAVADGTITQEQADWLISRLDNRQAGNADGTCDGDCTPSKQQLRRKDGSGVCLVK